MSWWTDPKRKRRYDLVIADGAVRAGKTFALSLGFYLWAMESFSGANFAFCGQSEKAVLRNVIVPLLRAVGGLYHPTFHRSDGYFSAEKDGKENRFYYFGAGNDSRAGSIQGLTLAGALFDEATLFSEAFFRQAIARCSVEGSKIWISCNPESPNHWLYRDWIQKKKEKHILYLHFQMKDNPSLSKEMIFRYQRMFTGDFYKRYVLGLWTAKRGLVYPNFSLKAHVFSEDLSFPFYFVSIDYGTKNPCSMGLWGVKDGVYYRVKESYYDGRERGERTDEEHYRALKELIGEKTVSFIVIDPSAASMIALIRGKGEYPVKKADNRVSEGILRVSEYLSLGRLKIHQSCKDCIREFSLYRYDSESSGKVVKEYDHAMDEIRYLLMTAGEQKIGFFTAS